MFFFRQRLRAKFAPKYQKSRSQFEKLRANVLIFKILCFINFRRAGLRYLVTTIILCGKFFIKMPAAGDFFTKYIVLCRKIFKIFTEISKKLGSQIGS